MTKFSLFTVGCRTNIAESERLRAILVSKNFNYTENIKEADLVFINTCTVTHKADRDSRKIFNRVRRINKNAKIFLTGCAIDNFKEEENVRVIKFEELLTNLNQELKEFKILSPEESGHSRYFLKIQEGCDYTCSFCIVPLKRGKSRSIDPFDLLKEVEMAISKGYREIVLTGTQIGDYGKELDKNFDLKFLIKEILKINQDFRIRLSSLHPFHVNKIYEILTEKKITPHLHIPLQSASEKVLKDMKRPYTLKFFDKILEKILKINRKFSIGTDIIVGFPTEKEKEFKETLEYVENAPFSYIHIFSYSKRDKTEAAKLKGLDPMIINERMKIIKEIDSKKRINFLNSLLYNIIEPVYEQSENEFLKGLSEYGFLVKFKGNNLKKGEITKVYVHKIENTYLLGYKI
ncbi:MAG: MiaB/RimO family radical SAM methylthiotransferase [Candidatus Hydrothermales bacterium]